MKLNAVKISIEEWAGDNGISLTEDQVVDLADCIDIAYDMSRPCGYGVGEMQTRESEEIKLLKHKIDMLERYIRSKGYNIVLHDDEITRMFMVNHGTFSASGHESFR
jgi:hypothetical protein